MPAPPDPYKMLPPEGLPPAVGPEAEQAKQAAAREAGNAGSGGSALEGVADLAEAGLELGSVVVDAAADVGGEVLGGALEAVGSGAEVLGGCAEGCSAAVAFLIVLAAAGAALAAGWN